MKPHSFFSGRTSTGRQTAGLFPRDLGRRIVKAEEIRHDSDYNPFYVASRDVTKQQIETAENLIRLVSKYYDDHKNEIVE